jgi:hypothetical protein
LTWLSTALLSRYTLMASTPFSSETSPKLIVQVLDPSVGDYSSPMRSTDWDSHFLFKASSQPRKYQKCLSG